MSKADVCSHCELLKSNRSRNKYCSRKCYWEAKVGSPGYWTGKERPDIRTDGKRCACGNRIKNRSVGTSRCKQCYLEQMRSRRGERTPNWKGGVTSQNQLIRNSSKMKSWRLAVFERDNYTCRGCGRRGGYIEAHHIKGFADYPDLRFVIDNGITYCQSCHSKNDPRRAGGRCPKQI